MGPVVAVGGEGGSGDEGEAVAEDRHGSRGGFGEGLFVVGFEEGVVGPDVAAEGHGVVGAAHRGEGGAAVGEVAEGDTGAGDEVPDGLVSDRGASPDGVLDGVDGDGV